MAHLTRKSVLAGMASIGMFSATVLPGAAHAATPAPAMVRPRAAMAVCGGVGYYSLSTSAIFDNNGYTIGWVDRMACNGSTSPQWVTATAISSSATGVSCRIVGDNNTSSSFVIYNTQSCTTGSVPTTHSAAGSGGVQISQMSWYLASV